MYFQDNYCKLFKKKSIQLKAFPVKSFAGKKKTIPLHPQSRNKRNKSCRHKKIVKTNNRGVAQLVAFLVWDQAVAGSSPVTPT